MRCSAECSEGWIDELIDASELDPPECSVRDVSFHLNGALTNLR